MNLCRWFILRPVATTLMMAAIVILGILGYRLLPVAPLPQMDLPTVMVSASLPGASPETMASSVATPLERALGQIAGITEMTSSSAQGSTSIVMQFELDRDINGAARDVQAAINASRSMLPDAMPQLPSYRKFNPSDSPILILSLTSANRSPGELYDIAESRVQPELAQVNGVGDVTIMGSSLPAIRIDLHPDKLVNLGISLDKVRQAVVNGTTNQPKGFLQGEKLSWMVASNDQLAHANDYRQLIVGYQGDHLVRLGDVADVYESIQNKFVGGYLNGSPAITIKITRQSGANMLATIKAVKARLPEINKALPADTQLKLMIDRSPTVQSSLRDTGKTLLEAIVLVIVVVFVFLRDWRSVLIPTLAIPVSLIGTCSIMYLLGYSLDNLSLMALIVATGFVVDDAIVVLENIMRHIEAGMGPLRAAIKGAREVSSTVLSMTFSLIAVFIPILLMSGIVGRLFREFAVTLSISLIISMFVSLSLTPMLCARLLKSKPATPVHHPKLFMIIETVLGRLLQRYIKILHWVLAHQTITLCTLLLTILVNVGLFSQVKKGFFPAQDTGILMGAVFADQNISYQAMLPKLQQYSKIIEKDPDVSTVMASVGGGHFGSQNLGMLFVRLKDYKKRDKTASQIANALMGQTRNMAGAQMFLMPAQDLHVGGRSSYASWQFSLQADDLDLLRTWTPKLKKAMEGIPQLTSVSGDSEEGGQQVMIDIDRDKASRLGLDVAMLDTLLDNSFSQRQIASIYKTLNQYKVVMMLESQSASDPAQLAKTYLINNRGERVPLASIATFSSSNAPLSVQHQGQSATSTLSFELADGVSLPEAQKLIKEACARIGLPSEIATSFEGTAKAADNLNNTMPWLILSALVAVYLVLGMLYESYIHPLTILSTLPSAGVGALLLLWLSHTELTLIALIGLILLIGIVKKNAIMMIDFALAAQRQQGLSAQQAIIQACLHRFRPIVMTSLAAFFGALPMALSNAGDAALRQPMGLAITGGLILSQVLTLLTTPVVYLWLDHLSQGIKRGWSRLTHSGNSV